MNHTSKRQTTPSAYSAYNIPSVEALVRCMHAASGFLVKYTWLKEKNKSLDIARTNILKCSKVVSKRIGNDQRTHGSISVRSPINQGKDAPT